MKIIVSYVSAGAGHFKAAEAVYNYIKKHCPGAEVWIVDALDKASLLFKVDYTFGYSFLVRKVSWAWRLAFWITDFKLLRPLTRPIALGINRLNTKDFARFLIHENPDVVISTHFLPSEISSNLKRSGKIKSKLITVITDFSVHTFWISPAVDIFIVASGFTREQLIHEGIPEEKIKESGIPIDPKFLMRYDRSSLCGKLGIKENEFTILLMTGSFGLGPLEKIVNALYKDVQILVVCASNKRLYARLKNRNIKNVKVFGFIDNPEELMAVSDIIITKPGGLTISEIVGMELPPMFISAIPGQEVNNVKVLKKYGIGLRAGSIAEIKRTVLDLKCHRDKLESVKEDIRKIKKPDCLREICDVVCQSRAGISG
ncbi:MAG: glycosyltransferase [Candidatus Omnitrophota bacterium]